MRVDWALREQRLPPARDGLLGQHQRFLLQQQVRRRQLLRRCRLRSQPIVRFSLRLRQQFLRAPVIAGPGMEVPA
jgi:hypothetical protein